MIRRCFRFATVLAATAFLVACGDGFNPDDPRLDGAVLEIVGSPAVTLGYNQVAELRVRYRAADGTAIASAPITYEVVGESRNSSLSARETATASNGEAAVELTAGAADATFLVTATPPRGDSVSFSVAVSNGDAGSIVVNMSYMGSRMLNRFDAFLFDVGACSMLNPNRLPTALRSSPTVSAVTARPAFPGVPVGSNHVVGVTARDANGLAAWGCAEGIVVRAGEQTTVNITLMDTIVGPDFTGVWNLDNRFDFADGLPPTVANVIDILAELTDDHAPPDDFCDNPPVGDQHNGRDPGSFFVDLAARQTCAWECMPSEGYSDCSSLNHGYGDLAHLCDVGLGPSSLSRSRFDGGCAAWDIAAEALSDLINEQLIDRFLPDWILDWATFAGDIARAINNARITSVLEINQPAAGTEFDLPMRHTLDTMTVIIHDPLNDGMEREFTFPMRDVGLRSIQVMDSVAVDGTMLTIPEHSFSLSFGKLVQYIYVEIILKQVLGYMSTQEMLLDYVDCAAFGMTLQMNVGILSAMQYQNACEDGISAVGRVMDTQLAGLIDEDAVFTISGTATGGNITGTDMQVGTLDNGMWTGYWGERDMTMNMMMSSDLTGTFTGVRRP